MTPKTKANLRRLAGETLRILVFIALLVWCYGVVGGDFIRGSLLLLSHVFFALYVMRLTDNDERRRRTSLDIEKAAWEKHQKKN